MQKRKSLSAKPTVLRVKSKGMSVKETNYRVERTSSLHILHGQYWQDMTNIPKTLKVKSKKCSLCGERHYGAVKVCEKCKTK